MIWSPQQDLALKKVSAWFQDRHAPQVFKLDGFAGTGKTTLARHFADGVNNVLFAAYTGKAASVLRQMGCPGARTLHSLLYDVSEHDRTKLKELEEQIMALNALAPEDRDEHLLELLEEDLEVLKRRLNAPRFTLNPESELKDADLLIVDECSMIDEGLAHDIESFGRKVLIMGDPAQLPPVKGLGYYSLRQPDMLLTEIHRQAAHNPILRFATLVREGNELPNGDFGAAKKLTRALAGNQWHLHADQQILVGKNESRRSINRMVRKDLGHVDPYPQEGERLVVLRNDKEIGVLNGVVCTTLTKAERFDGDEALVATVMYEGSPLEGLAIDPMPFDMYDAPKSLLSELEWQMNAPDRRWMIPMDYAYALTVHKAQGSQWDRVVIVDDGFGAWDRKLRRQWLYTAITRAKEELIIVGK